MDLELWELHLLSVVLSDFYLNGTLLMGMNIGCHLPPPSLPPPLPSPRKQSVEQESRLRAFMNLIVV